MNGALTDPLTGLANRRMLQRSLRRHADEQQRYRLPYAVLFADIDHFKAVNDTYGHEMGDRVLRLVASTLEGCTRGCDTVGRWGGEEFLLLAHVESEVHALRLAQRARRVVRTGWLQHPKRRIRVTLSIGIALARPGECAAAVVERADAAMLSAKAQGRDRCLVG